MKALTIRQPWCHAIFKLGKDVENRSWHTSYRGRLLIHAASALDMHAYLDKRIINGLASNFPLTTSALVGTVNLVDCFFCQDAPPSHVRRFLDSHPWADPDSEYWWIFESPVIFSKPIPCRGKLGLWTFENTDIPALP